LLLSKFKNCVESTINKVDYLVRFIEMSYIENTILFEEIHLGDVERIHKGIFQNKKVSEVKFSYQGER